MSLDGALGNMQIASDFRVIASLKQKIDDLPLPGSHLVKFLFHGLHLTDAYRTGSVWHPTKSGHAWNSGL